MKTFFIRLFSVLLKAGSYSRADGLLSHLKYQRKLEISGFSPAKNIFEN